MVNRFSVSQSGQTTVLSSLVHLHHFSESTNWVSTLLLTPLLWHHRCCHHNLADITKMQKDALVTGMSFALSQKPDIVCEPCLVGKMHSNPFPLSPSRS